MRRLAAAILLLAAMLGAAHLSDWPARWLVLEDPSQPVDAALVLGGDYWFERTTTGAALVRSGQARWLVLAGRDFPPGSAMDSRAKAIELGVPSDRIQADARGQTTRESLVSIAPVLRAAGIRSVALVTSPYHQRRAYLTARKAMPDLRIVNRPATPSGYAPPPSWWRMPVTRNFVLSEYLKLAYYALRGWV